MYKCPQKCSGHCMCPKFENYTLLLLIKRDINNMNQLREILKVLITRKNFFDCVVADVDWTYCGDHFTVYTRVESLCYRLKANIML